MVSVERTSKSEQILLKNYSLEIHPLQDKKEKNGQTRGSWQFLIIYGYKKIFSYLFLLLISLHYFSSANSSITRLTYFRHYQGVYCFLTGMSLPPEIKKMQ